MTSIKIIHELKFTNVLDKFPEQFKNRRNILLKEAIFPL